MSPNVLAYVAGAGLAAWGLAHVVPTRTVADAFGDVGADNRRILVMEWLAEGVAHVATGLLVVLVAAAGHAGGGTGDLVYRVVAAMLVVLATLTAATGARTPAIWFKACPFVLAGVAALLVARTLV